MSQNVYAPPRASLGDTKPCDECGELIRQKAEICPKCGVRQRRRVSKVALLLLTFFFGGLGVHKFYLRKPIWGIVYLLLCWTGITGLVALIEFIIYACTSEESLNEKYEASGGVVIFAVLAIVMVAVVGILAAIAIPAYSDYVGRAKVQQALQGAEAMREEVEGFVTRTHRLPRAPSEVRLDTVAYVGTLATVSLEPEGVMVVRFQAGNGSLSGQTVEMVPQLSGDSVHWDCTGGTLSPRSRPQACRVPK